MAKNFKKKRLFTVAALTVLLALAMLVFAACETGKTYTLTFETGNGSAVSPIKAKAGDKIDLPDEPTLDGHRFDGWYLSEDFSGEKAALPETMPAENRTYYAKFTAIKTATLTLDAAGGVLETSVFELEPGEKVWRIVSQAVPSLTGAVFGGWFNGNSAVTENTVMPANGLTLTARYKASYVVEVYLEDLNGEYGAPTDQVTFEGGSDWLGREVRLGASVLKAPEGFLLDQTKTQPITLVAGENVYKAYFYRADGYVYYFVNTPQGAEAEGEMDFATVTYGAPHTVSESLFTVRGYRFAGWSDSPEGEVVYAAGDEISQVKGTIMLYARWNYGATDAGGGADRIYLLMESPLKAVLERPVLGEKTGSYDPDTRLFEFEIADGRTLKGRMHADGKGFAYFDSDMTLTLTQVDGTAAGKATIALDGLDAALYTPENGAATEGSYTRVSPSVYQFSSESVRFRFRIEKSDGEDVFVMSDGYEGTYYYYNGGISYPVVILDGFGAAAYLADSESFLLTGAYAPSGEEIEVTYPNGDGEVRFLCRLGEEQGRTTSGDVVTVTVFYLADDTRGEYAIEDLNGAETYFYSDGFGKAYYGEGTERREVDYVYYREHGYYVVIDGKINYFGFVSMYLDGKNVFGCLNMTAKTGGLAEHNTVWTEENARSGFTVKLRILDSRTAAIEVSMTNGRWQRVITGENTYDEDAKIYHFAADWFAPDTENIKYEQLLAPFYGDFYYKSQGTSSFVIADDAFSEYTVYDGSAVYTLKCDGFGKGSLLKRGDANSVPIVYDYRHGYETENASYGFISFTLQMSLFTVRVNEDTKEGQLVTEFTELENRLPEQGEKFCFAAVDESGKGSAYISFPDGSGGFVAGIDGLASATFIPLETQENSSKLTLTYGGSSRTLTYTGKEKGSYYDLKLGAKIELDGKNIDNKGGTAKIYFKHQEYERKYKLEGTKLYIIWIEGTDGSEDVLWNWSFNSSTRKITGYWNYHLDEYEYYFEFGLLAEGEEKGAYTSAAGDKLTLDGFFVAEYTPASGQAAKWNYFMMSDVSVLLTSGESYKLLVLDDASFTETEVTETSVAGQYYVAERSYKVWLDGNGNMLYDSNMSVYTYVVEGNVFKLTSYDDSGTPHVHEGKFALATDGYIETAFYSYGYSYLRLFKEKLEYTTVSFKLDDKSYTLAIFENKFVYAYQYGQAIAYTGSVADYAAAKAAIAAKEDFEVTLDGTVYTASYDSDSWAWTFTPKS